MSAELAGRLAALLRRQQQQQQDAEQDGGEDLVGLVGLAATPEPQQQQPADPAAAGIAARMAVLKARLHASDAAAAAVTGDAATADSGEGSSQQAALLHRLQVLRQRQADVQESAEPDALLEQAAATTAAAGGSATASAEQVALLQRLQVLQQRDQQLQHQQQQGTAIEPGNPGLPTAAAAAAEQVSLLQRLQVLQQRHVVGSSADGYTQVDCSGLQTPGDFVECMRQLLASGELTEDSHFEVDDLHGEEAGVHSAEVPSGHAEEVQCADVDMACDGSSHLETAAGSSCAAAAAAAGGGDGDGDAASPMCVSPVRCGGTAPAAELPTQQQQQQQQQHRCVAQDQQQEQQQQQQQELAVPSHLRRLLVLAAQSLSAGRFAEAKDRAADALSGAAALDNSSSSVSSFSREAERLLAVAVVLLEVAQQHWLAALQLPIGPLQQQQQQQQQQHLPATPMSDAAAVTVGDVRRAYRQLAALVHPDKCRHPTAETAFKALTTAYEQALDQLKAAGSGMSGTAGQEDADVDDWGDPTAAAAACVDGGGIGNDYAWWTEWEQDVSEGNIEGAAAAGGDWGRPAAAAAAAQCSQASAADEEEELWALSMQELVAEVERRQAGILQPQTPDDAARTPFARQKRLRLARTVLSARMQQQRAASMAAAAGNGSGVFGGGGFVGNGESGGDGWQAGVHEGWSDFKRQRL